MVLIAALVLVVLLLAGIVIYMFIRRSVDRLSAKQDVGGTRLLVTMSGHSGSGRAVITSMDPLDVLGETPVYPEESMTGAAIPIELIERFFNGSLPDSQSQYIEEQLALQGFNITRNVKPSSGSSPEAEEGRWNSVPSGASVRVEDKPASDGKADGRAEKEAEDKSFGTVSPEDIANAAESDEGVSVLDNIQSASQIPGEVMDILLAAQTEQEKVICYYCSCRLGLEIDYKFDKACAEENRNRLRAIKEALDDKPCSEVVEFLKNYRGLNGGTAAAYRPRMEDTVAGGPSFARPGVEEKN